MVFEINKKGIDFYIDCYYVYGEHQKGKESLYNYALRKVLIHAKGVDYAAVTVKSSYTIDNFIQAISYIERIDISYSRCGKSVQILVNGPLKVEGKYGDKE